MYNKVILVGRLCADPELKYTPSGVAVVNFRIAVDRRFLNQQGERETDFINLVAWAQKAEYINTYLGKGRLVLVDGSLQVSAWQAPDGQRRSTAEVVVENIRPMERAREHGESGPGAGGAPPSRASSAPRREEAPPHDEAPDFNDVPDITDPFADQ